MRRQALSLLIAVATVAAPWPQGAGASCVGPMLAVGEDPRPIVTPGQRLTITGSNFVDGCDDTGTVSTSPGCSSQEQRQPVVPLEDIALSIRQHGRTWALGTSDAEPADEGRPGDVTWAVLLPPDLKPGRAVLLTDQARLGVVVSR